MKILAGVLGVIALFALRSALSDGFRSFVLSATADKASGCLTMLGNTTSVQDGHTFIIGSIQNRCDRKFGSVTIVFKLDSPSRPIADQHEGIAYAYSSDVLPGETRNFKTAMPISRESVYRFDEITAY